MESTQEEQVQVIVSIVSIRVSGISTDSTSSYGGKCLH